MLLDGLLPLLFRVAAVDAQYFHLALVLRVIFLHLGDALDAPAAPTAPEVQHHILAAQRRERQVFPLQVFQREVRSRLAFGYVLFGLGLFLFFLNDFVQELVHGSQLTVLCLVAQQFQSFFLLLSGAPCQEDRKVFIGMLADIFQTTTGCPFLQLLQRCDHFHDGILRPAFLLHLHGTVDNALDGIIQRLHLLVQLVVGRIEVRTCYLIFFQIPFHRQLVAGESQQVDSLCHVKRFARFRRGNDGDRYGHRVGLELQLEAPLLQDQRDFHTFAVREERFADGSQRVAFHAGQRTRYGCLRVRLAGSQQNCPGR